MNEKIKEFWEESTEVLFPRDGDFAAVPPYGIEKFAELIVKECIFQAREELISEEEIDKEEDIEDRCYLRGNNGGIVDYICRLKHHFGIEK